MYYFFPYIRYNVKTNISEEIILKRFQNHVIIVPSFSYYNWSNLYNFEGIILKDGFKLKRIIKIGYSSYLPILYCKFYNSKEGLSLGVTIRFNNVISIFTIIILIFLIIISLNDFSSFIFALTIYSILISLFNIEVKSLIKKAKKIYDLDDLA